MTDEADDSSPIRVTRLSREDIECARRATEVASRLHVIRIPNDDDVTGSPYDCDRCADVIRDFGSALVGACASVGIEHGKTTGEMFEIWLAREHRSHQNDPP